MQPDKDLLDELIRRIREVVEPLRIVLFGSAARGEMTSDSDLDVAVIVKTGVDTRAVGRRIYRNLIGYQSAADVIVLAEEDLRKYGSTFGMVQYSVTREGRDIYAA